MKDIKLAVCIPTYQRAEIVEEFLKGYLESYSKKGFDIYIYDSSIDDKTKFVVEQYTNDYTNLFYVEIPNTVHSNMKVYMIFQKFGLHREYDYIWVCSDSIRWSETVLNKIAKTMKENDYDLIVPNYRDVENIGDKVYTDCNDFFLDCAWHMTLYGACILKTVSMIEHVDWDYLTDTYTIPDRINHSHVAFYFEQVCKLANFKGLHLSFSTYDLASSTLKDFPGWQKETFYVWCHCWPSMIRALPSCYKWKKEVVKKNGINSGVLGFQNFVDLRITGILDKKTYKTYKSDWKLLTNVPTLLIWILSSLSSDNVYKINKIIKKFNELIIKRKIKKFCNNFSNIYIYGAGIKARRYSEYLEDMHIPYHGFVVSSLKKNGKTFKNMELKEMDNQMIEDSTLGILIALNEKNSDEVTPGLIKLGMKERIFSEYL